MYLSEEEERENERSREEANPIPMISKMQLAKDFALTKDVVYLNRAIGERRKAKAFGK